MGLCNKTPVQLVLKGNPKAVFRPKRPVANSMESVVEDELNRLESFGIIKKVDFSDWAAPIVVVRKPNGTVRICADFSTGLNAVLEPNNYPLPLPEDIFTKMANYRIFSHIDLSDADLQVQVDEASQPLLTINTHRGLFQFTRLSPGIKAAPGAFQQLMDAMLAGLECTTGYLDDILVGGRKEEEHQHNLQLVLERLQDYGFTVRIKNVPSICARLSTWAKFSNGIRPDPEKIAAIVNMPPPQDISTLRVYLGAVNYYGKYVKGMRTLRQPMDQLLKAGTKFVWSTECQKSFDRFRERLQSLLLLTHYNPKLEIILSTDVSNVGQPSPAMGPNATAIRFTVCYGHTESFGHADVLSRLMNRHVRPDEEFVIATLVLEQSIRIIINESLQAFPLSFKEIKSRTKSDDILQQVIRFVNEGWPSKKMSITDRAVQQFYLRRDGLSVVGGCLMYGERLVVPPCSRRRVLQQLHAGHPGVERMRSIARQYVYWPNIDDEVAKIVRSCNECSTVARCDRKTNLESWPAPEEPWQRLHLDYAGPIDGQYYLILVDSYSKWPEVVRTKDITTTATLRILQGICARYRQPETLVTANGPQLTSDQFETFCDSNGITHLKTAPFHPQSNGLAERFVDTFKRSHIVRVITSANSNA
ncbi:uncharacterized protein K02A2.6-like [Topomyia yanbarensis]|uniref:uncharacterized protein K02A2.6-like n=1 Tax=Topomyia yanbarensis TaxID=2498891 RepID=UPI00273C14F4|nr:uncharacterized protein K02A2.6-like [Topomyia yanbarensis]